MEFPTGEIGTVVTKLQSGEGYDLKGVSINSLLCSEERTTNKTYQHCLPLGTKCCIDAHCGRCPETIDRSKRYDQIRLGDWDACRARHGEELPKILMGDDRSAAPSCDSGDLKRLI